MDDPTLPFFGELPPTAFRGYWWGARAIYRNYDLDFLPDRQQIRLRANVNDGPMEDIVGEDVQRRAISTWLNNVGIPKLKEWIARECPSGGGCLQFEFEDPEGGYRIEANARSSCGYMYVGARQIRKPFAKPYGDGIPITEVDLCSGHQCVTIRTADDKRITLHFNPSNKSGRETGFVDIRYEDAPLNTVQNGDYTLSRFHTFGFKPTGVTVFDTRKSKDHSDAATMVCILMEPSYYDPPDPPPKKKKRTRPKK